MPDGTIKPDRNLMPSKCKDNLDGVKVCHTSGVGGTTKLGVELAAEISRGDCIALIGTLGAGKTALVRGMAEGLGLADRRVVSSPTFVLVQEYAGKFPIYHLDLYRMSDPSAELPELGLSEMLEDGAVIIEWADRALDVLPVKRTEIHIEITGPHSRKFTCTRPTI